MIWTNRLRLGSARPRGAHRWISLAKLRERLEEKMHIRRRVLVIGGAVALALGSFIFGIILWQRFPGLFSAVTPAERRLISLLAALISLVLVAIAARRRRARSRDDEL
jgi:hypothetical protein